MNGPDRLRPRRWLFAGCVFDESNWSLVVDGRRVAIEAKPLELLRELLLGGGELVTKDELLDRIWPDVHVVEASLTTAVHKLRQALGDDKRKRRIIETVSGLGYRFSVPAQSEAVGPVAAPTIAAKPADTPAVPAADMPPPGLRRPPFLVPRLLAVAGGLAVATGAFAIAYGPLEKPDPAPARPRFSQTEITTAVRKMDIAKIEAMIAAGWDPSTPWDKEGTNAFTMLLNICEWDRAHDRRKMLMVARTMIEAGIDLELRNVYGDTPYSIAKAPRYCGPDHPVTQMLEAMCYGGPVAPRDLCLATYELTAEQRKAQGLPPKG